MNERDMSKPTNRLKWARYKLGWIQEKVANELGVNPKTVERWENGKSGISFYYQHQLCELFKMSREELGFLPKEASIDQVSAEKSVTSETQQQPSTAGEDRHTQAEPTPQIEEQQHSLPFSESPAWRSDSEEKIDTKHQLHSNPFLLVGIPVLLVLLVIGGYLFREAIFPGSLGLGSTQSPTSHLSVTRVTGGSACTDAEYVADFYQLPHSYPQAKDWFHWLRMQGWEADGMPTLGDILVINTNKQGAGPEGYVGVIQQPVRADGPMWTVTIHSAHLLQSTHVSEIIPVADNLCNNVTSFTFKDLSAGIGDGVAFFKKG